MKHNIFMRFSLAVAMLLSAATATAHDFEFDGIYYKYNGDGTVSVTCQGNYSGDYANEYTGDVVIPSSVTYSGTTYSVTSIGDFAFEYCSGLTSVTIPNSVNSIGTNAFYGCRGLTSVTIPYSVTSIGNGVFAYCSGLTSITIPNSVNSIGFGVLRGISGLESIVVESGNSKYDSRDNCNAIIETATNTLLAGCKNTTIPNSITSIGKWGFWGCSGLTSVNIPNSVTSIGNSAFYDCSGLTSVTIPNSVNSIGDDAFIYCSSLTRVDISSLVAWLGIKFNTYESNPLYYAQHLYLNGEEVKDLVIPNSVTSIGNSAFYKCSGLTSVSIPNSVKSIGNYAFFYCSGLTSVNIPNSVTSIGSDAFSSCSGLTSVTIPNSVTSISSYAFSGCRGLTSVTIPNSVTSIGNSAFSRCSGLTSVSIPNSVKSIGNKAFYDCSGLTSVIIPNSVTSIGGEAFRDCSGLTTIIFNAINCADVAGSSWVFNTKYSKLIIGKDVKKIPNYLFGCYYSNEWSGSVISLSATPPTCEANSFDSKVYTTNLYVPSEAYAKYWTADVWSNFSNINSISNPITEIKLDHNALNLSVGNTVKLNATKTPSKPTIDPLYWSSDSPAATVDQYGNVKGVCSGTATITVEALDGSGVKATCRVSVVNYIATSISLTPDELKLDINQTGTITSQILPDDVSNKTVAWSTSNSGVAAFRDNNNGSITVLGVANGTATITARTTDGSDLSATCLVTVGTGAVEGVETNAARIYTAAGNIIIAATEDGEAAVYDFTGRLIKNISVEAGDNTEVPILPGCYIVKAGTKTQSIIVK